MGADHVEWRVGDRWEGRAIKERVRRGPVRTQGREEVTGFGCRVSAQSLKVGQRSNRDDNRSERKRARVAMGLDQEESRGFTRAVGAKER